MNACWYPVHRVKVEHNEAIATTGMSCCLCSQKLQLNSICRSSLLPRKSDVRIDRLFSERFQTKYKTVSITQSSTKGCTQSVIISATIIEAESQQYHFVKPLDLSPLLYVSLIGWSSSAEQKGYVDTYHVKCNHAFGLQRSSYETLNSQATLHRGDRCPINTIQLFIFTWRRKCTRSSLSRN